MFIYFFTLAVIFSSFLIKNFVIDSHNRFELSVSSKGICILSLFFCVLIGGFRWNTGTDWESYLNFFEKNSTWNSFFINPAFEIGWKILNFLIKSIYPSYTFFLFIFHSLIILFTVLAVKNLKKIFDFDVSLFYLLNFASHRGDFFATRQMLAMAIMLYAISVLLLKRKFHFIIFSLLAISIHISVILVLIIPILHRLKIKKWSFIFLSLAVFGMYFYGNVFFFRLMDVLVKILPVGHVAGKLISYIGIYRESTERLGLFSIFRIIMFLPFIYSVYKKASNNVKAIYNDYFFGCFVYIICGALMPILLRIPQNFLNLEALVLSVYIQGLKKTRFKYLIFSFVVVYALFKYIYGFYGEYSELFIPYYSIFNKGVR